MAQFDLAIGFVLENEGGYEPAGTGDPGGETNFGISKRSYPDEDIKNMSVARAKEIYLRDFWAFGGVTDQRVATKIFDAYVNAKHNAIRALQSALAYTQLRAITPDGNWGPTTEALVNSSYEDALLLEFKARLCKMHCDDAARNPAEAKDLLGWIRRDLRG
ncbi:MAG: glycosyl hydrolase 108 family protein [Candidatus Acidiferrales bacterium]